MENDSHSIHHINSIYEKRSTIDLKNSDSLNFIFFFDNFFEPLTKPIELVHQLFIFGLQTLKFTNFLLLLTPHHTHTQFLWRIYLHQIFFSIHSQRIFTFSCVNFSFVLKKFVKNWRISVFSDMLLRFCLLFGRFKLYWYIIFMFSWNGWLFERIALSIWFTLDWPFKYLIHFSVAGFNFWRLFWHYSIGRTFSMEYQVVPTPT